MVDITFYDLSLPLRNTGQLQYFIMSSGPSFMNAFVALIVGKAMFTDYVWLVLSVVSAVLVVVPDF